MSISKQARAIPKPFPWLLVAVATITVGVGVALTYFLFEQAVRVALTFIWDDLLDTNEHRLRVVPLVVALSLVYFGVQHWLDRRNEHRAAHGLGNVPTPTLWNYAKGLLLGFLSLVAGASLGPEAVLVPASVVLGGLVGKVLLSHQADQARYLAALGFVALMAAFFGSFIMGILGLLLVKKQFNLPLKAWFIIASAGVSLVVVGVLSLLESKSFVDTGTAWIPSLVSVVWIAGIAIVAYGYPYVFRFVYKGLDVLLRPLGQGRWWLRGSVAGAGLATLYIIGGPLVQFTGNESMRPLLEQAASLGLWGIVSVLIIKILAIAWSKTAGYRGGLIFPTVFILSGVVAIATLFNPELPFALALTVAVVAVLVADRRVNVLL